MPLFSNKTKSRLIIIVLFIGTMISGCFWFSSVNSARTDIIDPWDLQNHQLSKALAIDEKNDNVSGLPPHSQSGHPYEVNNPEQTVVISKRVYDCQQPNCFGRKVLESS